MGVAAALGGIAQLGGAYLQNKSAKSASKAQQQAADAAIAEQRRQFDMLQANQQPYMQYGQGAGGLGGLSALMGGDYSGFYDSPDYQAAMKAMTYANDHSAAAKGRLFSGGYAKDLSQAQGDLAAGYLGNYRGALQWGANLGQNAAAGVGQQGMAMAGNIGNMMQNAGDARASNYLSQGNNYAGALNGLAGLAGSLGKSSYGGGSNASNFGLPAPAQPYAATGYGSGNWFGS